MYMPKSASIFKGELLFSGEIAAWHAINSKLYRTKSVRLNSQTLSSTSVLVMRCHLSVLKLMTLHTHGRKGSLAITCSRKGGWHVFKGGLCFQEWVNL